jgi:hypothetical protein
MDRHLKEKFLLWSAILALASAVPFIGAYSHALPNAINSGVPGLVSSTIITIICVGCIVITISMFFALFRNHNTFSIRMMWLGIFLVTGWFGCSFYYFIVYRRERAASPA